MGLSAISNPLSTAKAVLIAKASLQESGGFSLGGFVSGLASSFLFGGGGGAKLGKLECKFNPKELSISKSAKWGQPPNANAASASAPEYQGAEPRQLTMELLFDEWEALAGDIRPAVEMLLSWTQPVPDRTPSQAPIVEFQWGSKIGDFYLKQASVKYTMFRKNGTPVRALANVTLQEVPAPPPPTNPTSGGIAGRRTRMVMEGDSLHSIAFQEYGHPKYWRGLATANGIDDPLRVGVGSTLLIPPRSDVADLS